MSPAHLYHLCCRYHGRVVKIRQLDGRVHVGRITRVNPRRVWIQPVGRGFGYGYYRGFGIGVPIALSFIAGIAVASAFFW